MEEEQPQQQAPAGPTDHLPDLVEKRGEELGEHRIGGHKHEELAEECELRDNSWARQQFDDEDARSARHRSEHAYAPKRLLAAQRRLTMESERK